MKIFIRNTDTGLYWTEDHQWTESLEKALGFDWSRLALEYASTHRLDHFELLFSFPDPQYNFALKRKVSDGPGSDATDLPGR